MPQNDIGFWETLATALASGATLLSAWAWKHTHGLIGKKAEATAVESLLQRFDNLCRNQREDNQRIFDQIEGVSSAFRQHAEKVAEELGKRPTRDECRVIWHREDMPR